MRKRVKLLVYASTVVIAIGAIFCSWKLQSTSAQAIYQLVVWCDDSGLPAGVFGYYDKASVSVGTTGLCAGKCKGRTVSIDEALAGLPAEVSAGLRAKVAKHEEDAAAGIGHSIAKCVGMGPEDKCNPDKGKLCSALSAAYRSITTVVNTLTGGAQPNFSFSSWKREMTGHLNMVYRNLCDNPGAQSRLKGSVIDPLNSLDPGSDRTRLAAQLTDIAAELNYIRVSLLQSGGPCEPLPPSASPSPSSSPSPSPSPSPLPPPRPGSPPSSRGSSDLAIKKVSMLRAVMIRARVTYRILVTNSGPNDATNVVVTDRLPIGTTFVTAGTSQPQQMCSFANGAVTCNLGNLPNGASANITIVVTVTHGAGPRITNSASVTSATNDPNTANNKDSVKVRVLR